MRYVWLLAALAVAGCASAPIRKQDLPRVAQADARVLEGCYDCLLDARDIYQKIAVGKARPLLIARLFETQLLIALREKELSLPSDRSFGQARELAKELPPSAEAERYLTIAEAVPPEPTGTPRRELQEYHRAHLEFGATIDGEIQWLKTAAALREPVRQYLALSIDCGFIARSRRPGGLTAKGDAWTASLSRTDLVEAPPLVAYRAAVCETLEPKVLTRLRAATPEFAEAALHLGRLEVTQVSVKGASTAAELLAEARGKFPDSILLNYVSGSMFQLAGDCRAALEYYEKVIAPKPLHEDALLGRTACLSFLRRHGDAIAAATRMIEIPTDNQGHAYYWRAWNHHVEKRLDAARADVERAKTLLRSEDTFTLAGMIEHDQDDLSVAESDLTRARGLDRARTNCAARWYLALVRIKQERWGDSSKDFEDAMGCYDRRVKDTETRLTAMEARTDLDPAFRSAQIAGFQAAIKEDRGQQYAAAFNAANQAARVGDTPRARTLLDIAAQDPALSAHVAELRDILKDR